ncbi:MAG: hypothetical protein AB7F86_02265 [Bdellovibrionales bacterium]
MSQYENGKDSLDANVGASKALKSLQEARLSPSPFLAARITAKALAAEPKLGATFGWRAFWAGALASVLLVATSFWVLNRKSQVVEYAVEQPYMLKVDLRSLDPQQISYVVIELQGQPIRFASEKFSEVAEMKSLTLKWENLVGKQYLPLVVKGTSAGDSKVVVHFYDENSGLIMSKDIKLKFSSGNI